VVKGDEVHHELYIFLKPLVLHMMHAATEQFQRNFTKFFSLLYTDVLYHYRKIHVMKEKYQ